MPNAHTSSIRTVDVHIGGDVHQIIVSGVGDFPGRTPAEKREFLRWNDGLRELLLNEPRGGHPSHFANLVVPPAHPEAEAGFVIMEYMGYPLFSGSNSMSVVIALLEDSPLPLPDGDRQIVLESPGGLVTMTAVCRNGKVISVSYKPDSTAFVALKDHEIDIPGHGTIRFDLIWSGCFYCVIDGPSYGFDMIPKEERAMGEFAHAFMQDASRQVSFNHIEFGDQGQSDFVLMVAPPLQQSAGVWERIVSPVVFPGSVSRCPSGTGTTAAIAQMVQSGMMVAGDRLISRSCWGTRFEGACYETMPIAGTTGCRVEVTGEGWIISRKELVVDFTDPLTPGNGLKEILKPE